VDLVVDEQLIRATTVVLTGPAGSCAIFNRINVMADGDYKPKCLFVTPIWTARWPLKPPNNTPYSPTHYLTSCLSPRMRDTNFLEPLVEANNQIPVKRIGPGGIIVRLGQILTWYLSTFASACADLSKARSQSLGTLGSRHTCSCSTLSTVHDYFSPGNYRSGD